MAMAFQLCRQHPDPMSISIIKGDKKNLGHDLAPFAESKNPIRVYPRPNALSREALCREVEAPPTQKRIIRPRLADHRKPWWDFILADRRNGENGLLSTPSIEHLFDRWFIDREWR